MQLSVIGLMLTLGILVAPLAAEAQQLRKVYRIGQLSPRSRGLSEHGVFFLRRVLYPSPRARVGRPLGGGFRQKVSEMGGHQQLCWAW
jgi:hypothetical protein